MPHRKTLIEIGDVNRSEMKNTQAPSPCTSPSEFRIRTASTARRNATNTGSLVSILRAFNAQEWIADTLRSAIGTGGDESCRNAANSGICVLTPSAYLFAAGGLLRRRSWLRGQRPLLFGVVLPSLAMTALHR